MSWKKIIAGVVVVSVFACLAFGIAQFVRARNTSSVNSCINNLRQIDSAKQQWALEHNARSNAIPTWDDIRPYLGTRPSGTLRCPHGGSYTIGRVAELPRCSYPHDSLDPKEQ